MKRSLHLGFIKKIWFKKIYSFWGLIFFVSFFLSYGTTIEKNSTQQSQSLDIQLQNIDNESTRLTENMKVKEKAVQLAIYEWVYFGSQTIVLGELVTEGHKETDDGYWEQIESYWVEGADFSKTGKDTDWPWSAAFISWIMKKSGMQNDFPYSVRHSAYITSAIQNKKNNVQNAPIIGYKLQEYSPEVGDLVCYSRQENINYDSQGNFKSHCDIVVRKNEKTIEVIGGNVDDSVTLKVISIDSQGMLNDKSKPWFVVIQVNR